MIIETSSRRLQAKIANALIDFYLERDFTLMPDKEWVEVSVKVKLDPRDLCTICTTGLEIKTCRAPAND